MDKFTQLTAIAAPIRRINIDTDIIIPSREMKRVSKQGLGEGLFAGWRYSKPGGREENPEFILNQPPYRDAQIILTGANFGCGSSREHAVWALHEWGIRCIVAPSFGSIFHGNCVRNGILPLVLDDDKIAALADLVEHDALTNKITVDLVNGTISAPEKHEYEFAIGTADRDMLLNGLDAIALTLQREEEIAQFEQQDRQQRPWAYALPD